MARGQASAWQAFGYMQKSLKLALMLATFLLPNLRVFGQTIVAVEENGHKVYVNDTAAAPSADAKSARQSQKTYRLVYWSQTAHRWKPVPGATTLRKARTAAAEVASYLGMDGIAVPKVGEKPASETAASQPAAVPPSGIAPEMAAPASVIRTSAQVEAAIEQAAARHHVDPNLVRAVVKVESNFNPNAVSRKGAMGLMQLMPGTARELAVTDPFDPQQNVEAGVRHLRGLLDSYDGDVSRSLAAYNAGAKAVATHHGVPPYAETQDYVRRITKLYGNGTAVATTDLGPQLRITRGPGGVLIISNTD
jgi:soluble lytic murein transglycosylase-like protein